MFELKHICEFPHEIIATDEVGRGPLGGPVVIGAVRVLIPDEKSFRSLLRYLKKQGVGDSKQITPDGRREVLNNLQIQNIEFKKTQTLNFKDLILSYITWDISPEMIDQENILAVSLRGMKEAASELSELKSSSTTVFIDGNMKFRWTKKAYQWNEIPIIQGDSKSLLIGLASIIAKEKRDDFMKEMHVLYPQYGFNSHFGYPTKFHREAIQKFGPSPIHRKTFKGVKEFITA